MFFKWRTLSNTGRWKMNHKTPSLCLWSFRVTKMVFKRPSCHLKLETKYMSSRELWVSPGVALPAVPGTMVYPSFAALGAVPEKGSWYRYPKGHQLPEPWDLSFDLLEVTCFLFSMSKETEVLGLQHRCLPGGPFASLAALLTTWNPEVLQDVNVSFVPLNHIFF